MNRNTQLALAIAGALGMYLASPAANAGVVCVVDDGVGQTTAGSTAPGADATACGPRNTATGR